jgi:hypothetical protein
MNSTLKREEVAQAHHNVAAQRGAAYASSAPDCQHGFSDFREVFLVRARLYAADSGACALEAALLAIFEPQTIATKESRPALDFLCRAATLVACAGRG